MVRLHKEHLLAAGGIVAIGGIAYHLFVRRRRNALEADAFEFKPVAHEKLDVKSDDFDAEDSPSADEVDMQTQTDVRQGTYVFENIGSEIWLPSSWKIAEDISPVPNVAMISIQNMDYKTSGDAQNQMPGSSPIVVLTVEDTSSEGLDLEEFKEKSKQTAMQQMYMMTNGMVPPSIKFDGPEENGVFQMTLEYGLDTPYFQMRVINFITLRDDLAYVLQFMGNGDVFNKEIKTVREIARNFKILKLPENGPANKNFISSTENSFSLHFPSQWIIKSREIAEIGSLTRVLSLNTCSPVKLEEIDVLRSKSGEITLDMLKEIAEQDKGKKENFFRSSEYQEGDAASKKYKSLLENGISVFEYVNVGSHLVMILVRDQFALKISPMKVRSSILKNETLVDVMKSMKSDAKEDKCMYMNYRNNFSFNVKEKSRIVESRIGDNSVTFAPEGIQSELIESISSMKQMDQTFEPTPIFTVRCGDPNADKDCEKTLEDWMRRLQDENTKENVKMNNIRYDSFNGYQCITFGQKEMTETAPGKKDEHQARIFIAVEQGKTFMLRWETPTEAWRTFEPKLNQLLESFNIY